MSVKSEKPKIQRQPATPVTPPPKDLVSQPSTTTTIMMLTCSSRGTIGSFCNGLLLLLLLVIGLTYTTACRLCVANSVAAVLSQRLLTTPSPPDHARYAEDQPQRPLRPQSLQRVNPWIKSMQWDSDEASLHRHQRRERFFLVTP